MPYAVVDSLAIAEAYIEEVLTNDSIIQDFAPGGVWNEAAEQGTTGRIIKYVHKGTTTAENDAAFSGMEIINDDQVYEIHIYLICVVGENDRLEDLEPGSTRIKQLFHKSQSHESFTQGKILWSKFLTNHKERVPHGGQIYPERGGYYQVAVQPPFA